MFNESLDSLNKLTIDEVLWMSEMIEVDQYMSQCWNIERKRQEAKNK
jgi:hypothetical protein